MLKVQGLHKHYRTQGEDLHVLKGIDLKIEAGELVSLFGVSGAGKSTLLHILGGLDSPGQGQVLLEGVNIFKIKEGKRAQLRSRKIGFVFQFYHLLPEFTALENVMLPALIAGFKTKEARKKALTLLLQVGLDKRSLHHPSELSGGEQQRVAIARALINRPAILFCDEPTGNLDSDTGAKICELLLKLNRQEYYTMMIATHAEEIAKISSRRMLIRDGKIIK
ncbi:MAG: ABC transporter ATP-binding protein [Candidatus Omnitrophica bacterium]|nr:ABC transporter ATP-binding protein [Candidatus Omnitrophota bacterium]MBU1924614.1 ABC transporter ATP-binding protein [Candidatus Omnitrophota bacterium]